MRVNCYLYVVFKCSADIFTRKTIVIMCFIACFYPFNTGIPCKLDDVEEIYINVSVPVILPIAF